MYVCARKKCWSSGTGVTVFNCHMSPGIEPGSSETAANALKNRAIFLSLDFFIQCLKQNTANGHIFVLLVLTQESLLYRSRVLTPRTLTTLSTWGHLSSEWNVIGITAFANFSLSPFIFILCLVLTNFYTCVWDGAWRSQGLTLGPLLAWNSVCSSSASCLWLGLGFQVCHRSWLLSNFVDKPKVEMGPTPSTHTVTQKHL